MKTVDITFHLPENSIEAEMALKSQDMFEVLKYMYFNVYSCNSKNYDFWDKVHRELTDILQERGLEELILRN